MGFMFSPGELPEELQQKIMEAIDHQQMHHASSHHDIMRLFEELSKDHLRTLTAILSLLARDGSSIAHYFEGLGVAHLHLKHDMCASCGESHTPNFGQTAPPKTHAYDAEKAQEELRQDTPVVGANGMSVPEYNAKLGEYRLVHSLVDGHSQFVCRDCGKSYPSLEDRMLRKPDHCEGCIHKAKWG